MIDAEGQYEGKYPQASYYMSTLRSQIGADYPVGLASFPYVDYHPALPYSVFLGPGGAQYNVPQLYWKDIGTTVDQGYTHTWVWNRIYGRPIAPLGQVYNNPKAGQIRRFRALAMSHGFDGVSWWSWQSAGKRQWKAVGSPVVACRSRPRTRAIRSCASARRATSSPGRSSSSQAAGTRSRSTATSRRPTQAAVYPSRPSHGLPQTGNLDVPTWSLLVQNKPLAGDAGPRAGRVRCQIERPGRAAHRRSRPSCRR